MKKFIIPALFLLFSCAFDKIDIIQVGPWFSPKHWKEIEVYSSKEQTTKPWGAIAIIHGPRTNSADRNRISKQIKQAKKEAARIGADAVILIEQTVARDDRPLLSKDDLNLVFISGIAIKYVDEVSTTTQTTPGNQK